MGSLSTRRPLSSTCTFMTNTENSDQRRLNLEGLVRKLRYVTLAVQIMPFIYTVLYLISMVFYLFSSDVVIKILDTLFYVSPVVIVYSLVLSKLLRLCVWHKTACILPLIPQVLVILDRTFILFSQSAMIICVSSMAIMCVLLLISAYHVFIK